jgi:hypothetical protein
MMAMVPVVTVVAMMAMVPVVTVVATMMSTVATVATVLGEGRAASETDSDDQRECDASKAFHFHYS